MPVFEFEAPNGKLLEVEGENPPTEGQVLGMFSEAYPGDDSFKETVFERIGSAVGSAAQAAVGIPETAVRFAANAVGMASDKISPLVAFPTALNLVAPLRALTALKKTVEEEVPTLPQARESFLTGDVPSAIGSLGGAVATGVVAGPVIAMTVMFGAEAQDAYDAETARQERVGEEPNADKAMFKAVVYGTGATAIEYGLGAGYILRRIGERFGKEAVKETVEAVGASGWGKAAEVLKGTGKAALAGFVEETAQSALQQGIVEGDVNWKQALREGAAGAVGEGMAGGAIAAMPRPTQQAQPPKLDPIRDAGLNATADALESVQTIIPESGAITGVSDAVANANAASDPLPLTSSATTAVSGEANPTQTLKGGDLSEVQEVQRQEEVLGQAQATQTEMTASSMTSGRIQPPIVSNEKVVSRSNWSHTYIPTTRAPTEAWAKEQVDGFQGDLIGAAREAVVSEMTPDQKTILLTDIIERAGKRAKEPFEEESNQLALQIAGDALVQLRSSLGQGLQAQKVALERLTPFAPIISYVTQVRLQAQNRVKRSLGDPAPIRAAIESGAKQAGGMASETLAAIIDQSVPTTTTEEPKTAPHPVTQKTEFQSALEELKDAASKFLPGVKLGIVDDPKTTKADRLAVSNALFKLAKIAIKNGVKTVEEFAVAVGVKVSDAIRSIWEHAQTSDAPYVPTEAVSKDIDAVAKTKISQPNRTAKSLISEFSKIQSDTPSLRGGNANAIRRAFAEQTKNPVADANFIASLVALKVEPQIAERLAQIARREVASRESVKFTRDRGEAEKIISGENKLIQRLLSKAGAQSGVDWKDLFQTSQANQQARRAELNAKVLNNPSLKKLTDSEKAQLSKALSDAWEKLRDRVFTQEFGRLVPIPTVKPKDKVRIAKSLPRLIRLINLGALDDAEMAGALAPEYGVGVADTAVVSKLKELSEKAQAAKREDDKNKIYQEMIRLMDDARNFSVWDAIKNGDWWFASVLARIGTFANVVVGSATTGVAWTLLEAADTAIAKGNPRKAAKMLGVFLGGMLEGGRVGAEIVRRGNMALLPDYRRRVDELMGGKRKSGDVLEALLRRGNPVGVLAYTRRIMAALDYFAAQGGRDAGLIYAAMARGDQAQIDAVDKRFNAKAKEDATREAKEELGLKASKVEIAARTRSILESGIDPEVREGATGLGRRIAANADPIGLSGSVYRFFAPLPLWVKAPFGLAFLRASLNMVSNASDFVPGLGAATFYRSSSAFKERFGDSSFGKLLALDMPPEQRRITATAQIFGLGLLAAGAAWATDDDENENFEVSGGWRNITPVQSKELRSLGQQPYSIKLGGRWWSYKQTPVAAILAMIGTIRDNKRFDKKQWDKKTIAEKVGYAWLSGVTYIKDIAALSQIAYMFGANAGQTEEISANSINQLAARTIGRFAGGFVPSIFKEIEDFMDPTMRVPSKDDMLGQWAKNFPVVGRLQNKPAINFLGDDVKLTRPPMRSMFTSEVTEPVYKFVGKWMGEGVFVPHAGKTSKIYDTKTEEIRQMNESEYYEYSKAFGQFVKEDLQDSMKDLEGDDAEYIAKYYKRLGRKAHKAAKAELGMIIEDAENAATNQQP